MSKLVLTDVKVFGDDGNCILDVASFVLESGTFFALKGVSGAGKSTFLNTISGIITPNQGSVSWDGTDITTLNEEQKSKFRRENVGIIFQDFPLFEELSSFENITIASKYNINNKTQIEEDAKRLMAHFGFDHSARNVKSYSGGQKQRIAFMRALVGNPKIVIADEPTAALDSANAKKMTDFLSEHQGDKTMIVTSHDDYVLRNADRVLTIDAGKLIEAS